MARDTGDNVAVDFVWGNVPMQPNDDRGMAVLDRTLSFHEIAYTKWSGYPEYVANNPGTWDDIVVPDLAGKTLAQATTVLTAAGLTVGEDTTSSVGATVENNGKVRAQSPVAGTVIDPSDGEASLAVDVVLYEFVPTAPAAPTDVVVTPSALSMSIAFVPGDDGGSEVLKFEYSFDGMTWNNTTPVATASPIVLSVPADDYDVYVRAVNAVGNGAASAPVSVTVPAE